MVEAYIGKEELGLAIIDFDKAIEINPNLAAAYANRALAYGINGLFDLAIVDYTKAIELDSDLAKLYFNRALAYKEQDKKAEAIADFEKSITLTGNSWLIDSARELIEELSE